MKKLSIISSFIWLVAYLLICYFVFNKVESSISAYAKDWRELSMSYMPHIWLGGMFFLIGVSLVVLSEKDKYTWTLFAGTSVLTLIGYWQGMNGNNLHDILHVIFVYVSIAGMIAYLIFDGFKYRRKVIIFSIIFINLIFCILAIKYIPKHTYWIENVLFLSVFSYLITFKL